MKRVYLLAIALFLITSLNLKSKDVWILMPDNQTKLQIDNDKYEKKDTSNETGGVPTLNKSAEFVGMLNAGVQDKIFKGISFAFPAFTISSELIFGY